MNLYNSGYDSSYEGNKKRKERDDIFETSVKKGKSERPNQSSKSEQYGIEDYRSYFSSFNAFDRHKILVNQYLLYYPGATSLLKKRSSNFKTDIEVIQENHQFLWQENAAIESWGKKIAKKYYDKLYKEYCICDLTRYKEGQIGMRWRVEGEVVKGSGQFACGNKRCDVNEKLRTWEMNFGYVEEEIRKNALVKLRLCHDCSYKLNYKHRRKEVRKERSRKSGSIKPESCSSEGAVNTEEQEPEEQARDLWKKPSTVTEVVDKEDEFEEYLEGLFL